MAVGRELRAVRRGGHWHAYGTLTVHGRSIRIRRSLKIPASRPAEEAEAAARRLATMIESPLPPDAEVIGHTTWRPIPSYPDYVVSEYGHVRRRIYRRETVFSGRVLSRSIDKDGRVRVNLYQDGQHTVEEVHQLVAMAFFGPPPPDAPLACHIDGDPANNHWSNLYYGTAVDNALDAKVHAALRRARRLDLAKASPEPGLPDRIRERREKMVRTGTKIEPKILSVKSQRHNHPGKSVS